MEEKKYAAQKRYASPKVIIPVIINGSGGVGKDTFVEFCKNYARSYKISFWCDVYNYSSVDIIKDAAKVLGWDGGKTEKDRKFLADLKQLAKEYNNCSIKYMAKKYNDCKSITKSAVTAGTYILFFHIREPEEIEEFKNYVKNPITVLVRRDNTKAITSNSSDANVENYVYDRIIENNGSLDDLYNIAVEFINSFDR